MGCEYADYTSPSYVGNIVLVRRGACSFFEKAMAAQDMGALGIVVIGTDLGVAFRTITVHTAYLFKNRWTLA